MVSLEDVRWHASQKGYTEVQFNETSRVMGFVRGNERVNVYWTTGTVGTCVNHPKQGKTQLFRRNQTMNQIVQIFENPRVHTGAGYYRRQSADRPEPSQVSSASGLWCCLASQSLQDQLCRDWDGWNDAVLALGAGYFVVQKDGSPYWSAGLPPGLYDKVHGRLSGCPERAAVDYVSLGPDSYYFVQFMDGSQQWCGPESLTEELRSAHSQVELLAFGPDDGWYVLYEDGHDMWEGIPRGLHNQINGRMTSLGCTNPAAIVEHLAMGPGSEWFVRYAHGAYVWDNIRGSMSQRLNKLQHEQQDIIKVAFGHDGTWAIQHTWSG